MKILIMLMLFCSLEAYTQCPIIFDYDPAGNRIKRYYASCLTGNEDDEALSKEQLLSQKNKQLEEKEIYNGTLSESNNTFIYPNPSNGHIKIETTDFSAKASVKVCDMSGKTVYTGETRNNYVDLTKLIPGIYMIILSEKIKDGTKTFQTSIILQ